MIKWKQEYRKYKRWTKKDMTKELGRKKERQAKKKNEYKDTKWSQQTSWSTLFLVSTSLFSDAVGKKAHVHLSASGHVPYSKL
jgi:hypothetical protein